MIRGSSGPGRYFEVEFPAEVGAQGFFQCVWPWAAGPVTEVAGERQEVPGRGEVRGDDGLAGRLDRWQRIDRGYPVWRQQCAQMQCARCWGLPTERG